MGARLVVGFAAATLVATGALAASSSGRELSGYGVRISLPAGWDAQLRSQGQPSPDYPYLVLGNFKLPVRDNDVGTSAVRRMRARHVRILLFEVGNAPGTGGFRVAALPLRIRRPDFTSAPQGIPPQHAFARRRFAAGGRSFVLWGNFGARPAPPTIVAAANRVLASLRITPRVSARELAQMRRPLRRPRLGADGACPRSRMGRAAPKAGRTLGDGPAYPVLSADLRDDPVRSGWYFHKTLWAVAPRYSGPLVIRGVSLGRARPVRFDAVPRKRLVFPRIASRTWRYAPTSTLLRGPGCYAFQVDGLTFSRTIVFEARL